MIFSYQFRELESIKLEQLFNNQEAQLVVTEVYANAIWGLISTTTVRVDVVNQTTNKKIEKNKWDNQTLKLADLKKQEHQPSFFQRIGKVCLVAIVVLAILGFVLLQTVSDHKKTIENGIVNFSKAYETESQAAWINGLAKGDFILANKQYDDPAQVFKIESFTDSTVVLEAFDQFIPLGEYEELDKLNSLILGNTNSEKFVVKLKFFKKGILEDISDDTSLSNKYIKQIKKK